jgi:hypothetical protein
VRGNPGSTNRLPALGLKEDWPAGSGDAGDARGVKGPLQDFGCWAANGFGPKRERGEKIPFYFQKTFLWQTK